MDARTIASKPTTLANKTMGCCDTIGDVLVPLLVISASSQWAMHMLIADAKSKAYFARLASV